MLLQERNMIQVSCKWEYMPKHCIGDSDSTSQAE